MTIPRFTALFVTALLALTGCLVEPHPYVYRTYPAGVYAPPPPPPGTPPAAPAAMSSEAPPNVPPQPVQEQPEVLTRGPVHEAFAQPVSVQDQPGMVVPSQPPANITETPPADRPDGNACIWAPGYWNWDAERNNYIWVSGCWRLPPPKMAWVAAPTPR